MLPVSREVIISQMTASRDILTKWIGKVDEGIPAVDIPAPQEELENFLRALCGELLIVSGSTEVLSNVLNGEAP